MVTWPIKLRLCSDCIDSCKIMTRAPTSGGSGTVEAISGYNKN